MLVEKDDVEHICKAMQFPYTGRRISEIDAFHNATGSIARRMVVNIGGTRHILRVYCRDNQRQGKVYSRELIREMVDHETNHYEKLANLCYDQENDVFSCENVMLGDPFVDVPHLCHEAERLFHVYRHCLGRSQIDTIVQHFLDSLDALPISVYGKFFFVPRHAMHRADLFEDFIEALNQVNQHEKPLIVNSFFVVDDAKQREKMAEEFYVLVRREAQEYQERAERLIENGCQSAAVMEKLVLRMRELQNKRQRYETLFQLQLNEVDEEFTTLSLFSQELQLRSQNLRIAKAA